MRYGHIVEVGENNVDRNGSVAARLPVVVVSAPDEENDLSGFSAPTTSRLGTVVAGFGSAAALDTPKTNYLNLASASYVLQQIIDSKPQL